KKKGDSASSTTPPTPTPTTTMFKEQKPNNLKLHSKGADKRRTSLNNVVQVQMKELVLNQGFRMYHLMTRRKNFHGTLPMMKMNSKAYKEYYACATGEAALKPKACARKKKGDSASSTTPPTPTPTTTVVAALRLSATAKDEGTGSRPGVLDVPSDDSEEELSWN
nr:hypothetical protein [Tanacetum cinerariifolium]